MSSKIISSILLLIMSACNLDNKPNSDNQSIRDGECANLSEDCEKGLPGKICRKHGQKCIEVKVCSDLTPLGQAACQANMFAHEVCVWKDNGCIVKSKDPSAMLRDFQSRQRIFTSNKGVNFSNSHSEAIDQFGFLLGIKGALLQKEDAVVSFKFFQGESEGEFSCNSPAITVMVKPFKFSYEVKDIDADTMWIMLKTTEKKEMNEAGKMIDVAANFMQAQLMYVKSKEQLLFLFIADSKDWPKFTFNKPSLDLDANGIMLKNMLEPHIALIMTEVP